MTTRWVRHLRINLALHELQAGDERPLLLLHGLAFEGARVRVELAGRRVGPRLHGPR